MIVPVRICADCPKAISRTSKGRCRVCAAKRLNADPEIAARCAVARDAYFAKPETKAALALRIVAAQVNLPEHEIRRRREHGYNNCATRLHTPEAKAKALAHRMVPEVEARRGRSVTRARLPWCPEDLLPLYRDLTRKGMRAAEARAALEPMIPGTKAHSKRIIANTLDAMRIKQERDKAQAY